MKNVVMRQWHFSVMILIVMTSFFFYASWGGYIFKTRKTSTSGCGCHGNADTSIVITYVGPDTIPAGKTVPYQLVISGGPHKAGGTDIAVFAGTLTPGTGPDLYEELGELTHNQPKTPVDGVIAFDFFYTAPATPGTDTLYANGNSVNLNGDSDGDSWNFAPNKVLTITAPTQGIHENFSSQKKNFALLQNYPNPFNPATSISFQIPTGENVLLKVYDALGNDVQTLIQEYRPAGSYNINFSGSSLPSGMYYYRLSTGSFSQTKKMILLK